MLYVEGAAGDLTPWLFDQVASGLRATAPDVQLERVVWNTGLGLVIDHIIGNEHKRARAAELAARIAALHAADPTRPIDVLAFSAGSAVAVYALELLSAPLVRNVILLQSSLSSEYDLRAAIERTSGRWTVYASDRDALLIAAAAVGTADRVECGLCSIGLFGRITAPRGTVCVVHWRPEFAVYGHRGGHYEALDERFVAAHIAYNLLAPPP